VPGNLKTIKPFRKTEGLYCYIMDAAEPADVDRADAAVAAVNVYAACGVRGDDACGG